MDVLKANLTLFSPQDDGAHALSASFHINECFHKCFGICAC